MEISTILENLTTGSFMYYGGFLGIGVGILSIFICLAIFPKQRKKLLKKLEDAE